jgi:acyl carrier protein
MTPSQSAQDRIAEFVLKHFPLARKKGLSPQEKWLESGMIDSLGILDLVHFLEQEFSVVVADEDLQPENFQSLEAVTDFVRSRSEIAR